MTAEAFYARGRGIVLRNLVVLMSALVAMSSQAQDASTPVDEAKPTSVAPPAEGEQSAVVLASTAQPVESDRPLSSPSAPAAKPVAGVDASARAEPDDCGMEQSLFDQKDVPVGLRIYPPPATTALTELDQQQQDAWDVPPSVATVGRCLRKYVIQVSSKSEVPWEVKEAKLVGSDGNLLQVTGIRPRKISPNVSLNIITAVRTEGAAGPNYMLRAILLIGEDGRAIVLENVEMP